MATKVTEQYLQDLIDRRIALEVYLQSCVDVKDWHGVRDAACDIEVICARLAEASLSYAADSPQRGKEAT